MNFTDNEKRILLEALRHYESAIEDDDDDRYMTKQGDLLGIQSLVQRLEKPQPVCPSCEGRKTVRFYESQRQVECAFCFGIGFGTGAVCPSCEGKKTVRFYGSSRQVECGLCFGTGLDQP